MESIDLTSPHVTLALPNRAENVVLVREMLAGLAEFLGLAREQLDDIKTAVSEACNNVVLHAYGGEPGPLRVEARIADGSVTVAVRDSGLGIRPNAAADERIQGIGLSLIHALTSRVEFSVPPGGGTEVRMEFSDEAIKTPGAPAGAELDGIPEDDDDVQIAVATSVGAAVLTRVVAALAARARFSVDRLSDAQMLADTLAAHAGEWLDGPQLRVGLVAGGRRLALHVGPLSGGGAQGLIEATSIGGLGSLIDKLTDSLVVESVAGSDRLTLEMSDL